MKYSACLVLALCLTSHCLPPALAAAIEDADVKITNSKPESDGKTGRKIVTRPVFQDKMERRNFHVLNAESDDNLLENDDSRTISYSYLNYGGYPFLSFSRNTAYNVGFNSTQAGIVSLLGNAALALGGLFVLGKSRTLANSKPPVIKYRRPSYGNPLKFRKKKGQFTFRKRRPGRKPRPFRNHMSRHSPIPFTETKPKVLEPVKPLMLDDVAYDANYDEINYEDDYFEIGNIDNNLAQRKGPYDFESKRPFKGANFDPNERRRPSIMVKPSDSRNGGRITVEDNYPLPPIGKNSMMASMDDEMDTYFDPQEEVVAERPTTIEKNVYVDNGDSTISLTPDGKRLRRKSRRQTTTVTPITTTEATTTTTATTRTTTYPTTTSPRFVYTKAQAASTTTKSVPVPDFFAQNKPQFGSFSQKDEFDNYWSGDLPGGDKPFMEVFDPSSFGKFRQKSNDAKENGQVKRLLIEEKLPQQPQAQPQPQQPGRLQRKKVSSAARSAANPFDRSKFDPFSEMAKDFDVDNEELIATISKAFDGFSDFKKVENNN